MDDQEIRVFKPKLKFNIGDIVYLKSDLKRKTPMTITAYYSPEDGNDYHCKWMNSQSSVEGMGLNEKTITD